MGGRRVGGKAIIVEATAVIKGKDGSSGLARRGQGRGTFGSQWDVLMD